MAELKHRPLSTNDQEIETLKNTFASTDGTFPLLKSVRALFLGFPITKGEADVIRSTFKDPKVKLALRKKLYPIINPDVEIGEESDFWFGTETEIIGRSPEEIKQVVVSKQRCFEWLIQSFNLLDDPTLAPVNLAFNPLNNDDPFQIRLLTRNKYVKTVVTGLTIIKVIAGQKTESVEQAKQRLIRDSSK